MKMKEYCLYLWKYLLL